MLDVGCGNGQATRDVARVETNGSLGVDLSSQMLALAREIAIKEGLDNVEFRHGDAQIYPFEDAAFDVVIFRVGSTTESPTNRPPGSSRRTSPDRGGAHNIASREKLHQFVTCVIGES